MIRSIAEFVEQVKSFALFRSVEPLLLDFGSNIKSKIWTLEILTQQMNTIINTFLNSQNETIDSFFASWLEHKFQDNTTKKQKYCFTFLLSIQIYREKHPYVAMYNQLFKEERDYPVYEMFHEVKKMALDFKSISYQYYTNLDKIYISGKHWQLILNSCFGYQFEEIMQFETDMNELISQVKHEGRGDKVINYTRNNELCLTFFIREALLRFIKMHIDAIAMRLNNGGHDFPQIKGDGQYESIIHKISQLRVSRLNTYSNTENHEEMKHAKLMEKERLIAEIKNDARSLNRYKQSTVKLLSYIEEIDPLNEEIKRHIHKHRDQFMALKQEQLRGKSLEELSARITPLMVKLLEHGSELVSNHGNQIKRKLMRFNHQVYEDFTNRVLDQRSAVKVLIQRMRKIIFQKEFVLADNGEEIDLNHLRQEIEKVFAKFGKLENSHRMILETFFQNIESEGKADAKGSVSNLLERVSKKLSTIVDKGVGEGQQVSIEDQERFEKNLVDAFHSEFQKYESLKETSFANKQGQVNEFQKARYSSRPLLDVRRSSLKPVVRGNDGSQETEEGPRSLLLNFSKKTGIRISQIDGSEGNMKIGIDDQEDLNKECIDESVDGYNDEDVPDGIPEFDEEMHDDIPDDQSMEKPLSMIESDHLLSQVSSTHLIETQIAASHLKSQQLFDGEEKPRQYLVNTGQKTAQDKVYNDNNGGLNHSEEDSHGNRNSLTIPVNDGNNKFGNSSSKNSLGRDFPAFSTFNHSKVASQLGDNYPNHQGSNNSQKLFKTLDEHAENFEMDLRESINNNSHSKLSIQEEYPRESFNSLSVRRERVDIGELPTIPVDAKIKNVEATSEELQDNVENELLKVESQRRMKKKTKLIESQNSFAINSKLSQSENPQFGEGVDSVIED